MNRTAYKYLRQPWLAAILLIAFAVHVLIPEGFMPGRGGVILCLAHDVMLGDGGPTPSDPSHHGQHHAAACPFAAAAGGQAPAHAAPVWLPPEHGSLVPVFPPQRSILCARIVATHLPRGPPTLA